MLGPRPTPWQLLSESLMAQIRRRCARVRLSFAVFCLPSSSAAISAQWLDHPTPILPRTLDGKPTLDALALRLRDGTSDLAGAWAVAVTPAAGASKLLHDLLMPAKTHQP